MSSEQDRAEYRRRYVQHVMETGVDREDAEIAVDIAFHNVAQIDSRLREACEQIGSPIRAYLMLTVASHMLQHLSEHALGMAEKLAEKQDDARHDPGVDMLLQLALKVHGVDFDPKRDGVVVHSRDDDSCDCDNCAIAKELGENPLTQRVELAGDLVAYVAPVALVAAVHAKHTKETLQ